MSGCQRSLLCAVLLALVVPALAEAKGVEKMSFEYDGRERNYYVFAPPKTDGDLPLLLLLHGSNRDGRSLVDAWKSLAKKEGLLLVGPDSADSRLWAPWSDGPEFLRRVIKEVWRQYGVDENRMFLFGHSAGGHFALQVSLQESDFFAATAVHAGALVPGADFLIKGAVRPIPIAIWVGDRDRYVSVESVDRTRAVMLDGGLDPQIHVIEGHDHWYYKLAPKLNREIWEFLRDKRLATTPDGSAAASND